MTAQDNLIAVVDDSEIIREALDYLLVSVGYRTELCVGGRIFARGADHACRLPGDGRRARRYFGTAASA